MEDLKYPIGKFSFDETADESQVKLWIRDIRDLPAQLSKAVNGLSEEQLDGSYRDGGWSLRQVVHHIADSHLNAYCRIKIALTEEKATIKPYDENAWSALPDAVKMPVKISLQLVSALHSRWSFMNDTLTADDLQRSVFHPENNKEVSVKYLLALYSWHGKHHTAHILSARG